MKHVVFGTGPIGTALADLLASRGEQVVAVNRSGQAATSGSVQVVAGDASDPEFAVSVATGATVTYQCLNPPYTKWPELFPTLAASVLQSAKQTGAKLVSLENLYGYGPTSGAVLTEDLPLSATGRKGKVRADMTQELLDAHAAGHVRVAMGRAADYFGPRGVTSHMGERVFYPVIAGKKAQVMGDPDQLHTFSYIPDIAAGLATLGADDRADGKAWHLPNAPTVTTRQFITKIYGAAGTEGGVSAMSRQMVNLIGLFNGTVRELKETLFEFEEPFVVDSAAYNTTFGDSATNLDDAIPATVAWFRANPKG